MYLYICIYVYMYMYTCICMYIYIYIYIWLKAQSPGGPHPRGARAALEDRATPGPHNKNPRHKIFAKGWVAQNNNYLIGT